METAKNDKNEIMELREQETRRSNQKTEDGNTKTHRTRTRAAKGFTAKRKGTRFCNHLQGF